MLNVQKKLLMLAGTTIILSACAPQVNLDTNTIYHSKLDYAYTPKEVIYAAANRNLDTTVYGYPFGDDSVRSNFKSDLEQILAKSKIAKITEISTHSNISERLPYKLILVYNQGDTLKGSELCYGKVPSTYALNSDNYIKLHAIFCRGDKALSEIYGMTDALNAQDKKFIKLTNDVVDVLLPELK